VNVIVVVPEFVSLIALGELIVIVGAISSFVIVPTPWLSAIVAFVGDARSTLKVSFTSSVVSP
jgi:hypothetical protein